MSVPSELRIVRAGKLDAPRPLRHALDAFLHALRVEHERREDIIVAVGEALSNAVEHGNPAGNGTVELYARIEPSETLVVDVRDDGTFIDREHGTPGRGFGLGIVRAIARAVSIDTANGTLISMTFDAPTAA
ncbi:MAG TPA: ATP-binding protein [Candidatus Elarobacter sp.]|jgi:anti-sigma regulatory factor (Ser/Thr protein kinase)